MPDPKCETWTHHSGALMRHCRMMMDAIGKRTSAAPPVCEKCDGVNCSDPFRRRILNIADEQLSRPDHDGLDAGKLVEALRAYGCPELAADVLIEAVRVGRLPMAEATKLIDEKLPSSIKEYEPMARTA